MAIEFKDGKYVDANGHVTLDPTIYKDWQIAEEAEKALPPVDYFREKLGLLPEEIIPYGKTPKIDFIKVMNRLKDKPDGKFIEVTAITPTPFGEGKSTVSLGLIEGLGKLGLNVGGALRQPSGGPTMNVKGTAAGGGNALLMPMTEFSLGLTGDINDIMNAHNLAMVALNARMQHERNNNDEWLAAKGLDENMPLEDAAKNAAVRAEVQKWVDQANEGVSRAESVRKFIILPEEFTQENGLMTASMKVIRPKVIKRYSTLLNTQMYTKRK